jgi:hypothetical protein
MYTLYCWGVGVLKVDFGSVSCTKHPLLPVWHVACKFGNTTFSYVSVIEARPFRCEDKNEWPRVDIPSFVPELVAE